jgi:hypothetical protein
VPVFYTLLASKHQRSDALEGEGGDAQPSAA